MPANRGASQDWHPEADFGGYDFISHQDPTLITYDQIADWVEDMGVLPDAEAYRLLGLQSLAREIVEDVAERVYLDVSGEYFTPHESLYRHLLKQQRPDGPQVRGVVEYQDGTRDLHLVTPDLLSA